MTDATDAMNADLLDFARLLDWMTAQGLGSGPIEDVIWLSGGTQNVLVQFRRDGRAYVLRRPPLTSLSDGSKAMMREARVLRSLAGTAVPHPGLIRECPDRHILGEAFYLMEKVDGFNVTAGLPPAYQNVGAQREIAFAVVDAALKLGAVDYLAVGLDGFGKLDGYLERQVGRWGSQLESYARFEGWPGPGGLPGVSDIAAWLDANVPDYFSPGIVHGDFHLSNIMFRQDEPGVAAIIDWELATIGEPLLDLGWLVATWPSTEGEDTGSSIAVPGATALPTIDELVARYAEGARRDMKHFRWVAVLACYKLGILQEGSHARACADKNMRPVGEANHRRAVGMMRRAQTFIDRKQLG